MARHISKRDLGPILAAASTWVDTCWVNDGSLFSADALWTPALIEEVRAAFVDNPDEGGGDFMTKLKGQMAGASAAAQRLMAEMQYSRRCGPLCRGTRQRRSPQFAMPRGGRPSFSQSASQAFGSCCPTGKNKTANPPNC